MTLPHTTYFSPSDRGFDRGLVDCRFRSLESSGLPPNPGIILYRKIFDVNPNCNHVPIHESPAFHVPISHPRFFDTVSTFEFACGYLHDIGYGHNPRYGPSLTLRGFLPGTPRRGIASQ
eukprot:7724442-Pyramimonas_sp.AAC.1